MAEKPSTQRVFIIKSEKQRAAASLIADDVPVEIRSEEVARKHSLGDAIQFCAELAGFSLGKELQQRLDVDQAQFSRWLAGIEGIVWPKFTRLMDACGNDASLHWMMHQRGYDLRSLRKLDSQTEKQNRLLREASPALRRVLMGVGK